MTKLVLSAVAALAHTPLLVFAFILAVLGILALTAICIVIVVHRDDGADVFRALADVLRALRGR